MNTTLLIAAAAVAAAAPSVHAGEFPAGATAPSADELRQHLAGRVFTVKPASGEPWRLDFKSNGYVFVNAGSFSTNGTWTAEDGKLCSVLRSGTNGCNDVRMDQGTLVLLRTNGEFVRYQPR